MSEEPSPLTKYIPVSTWEFIKPHISEAANKKINELIDFLENDVIPCEELYRAQISKDPATRWKITPPIMDELKSKAKERGLWNLWMSDRHYPEGQPLSNLEYGIMAELLGRHGFAAQATNSSAPDTGNMEVLAKYGTKEQKNKYLKPLMEGEIRSSFAMTEKRVASSDAKNIRLQIEKDGNDIVLNGRKWWISGAGNPKNAVHLVMGKSDPKNPNPYKQQSIVIVPANNPGVRLVRPMQVMGYDEAPSGHFEVIYDGVRVPESNLIAGWGRGFEVVQGRLGPGRIHHCMRTIGVASRALDLFIHRATDPNKMPFGKMLKDHGSVLQDIAKSRIEIDQCRLLVLTAAHKIDLGDAKGAMKDIGMAKASVPSMALRVLDRAMQAHGAEGLSQDTPLAEMWKVRTLRYADGPDEVHLRQVALSELKRADQIKADIASMKEKSDKVLKCGSL